MARKNDLLNEEAQVEFDEEGELNTFIVDSLVKFISSILIESTYFIVLNELCDFEGFYSFTPEKKLDYLKASYYTIVSFSTIGYGDVYPLKTVSRLGVCIALVVNITVMSNFLGKMVEFLFQLSPYDTAYDFQDHVVIIGQIGDDQLKEFLDELIQLDLAQRSLMGQASRIKTLIVSENEPSEFMVDMAFFYTEQYENEVNFLKEGIFTQSQKWQIQSNLKKARILFAFSWANDDGDSFENDQLVSLVATGVKEKIPNLRIVLILNSTFKDQFEKDSLYQGIEVLQLNYIFFKKKKAVSPFELNDFIMSSSLQNPGLGTILQHLITMQAKNIPESLDEVIHHDHFLKSYVQSLQQEIYQFVIPDFYIGMTFQQCAKMLYLYGLQLGENEVNQNKFIQDHIKDDRKMTLIAVETQSASQTLDPDTSQRPRDDNPISNVSFLKYPEEEENGNIFFRIILKGFILNTQTKKSNQSHQIKSMYTTNVFINPINYTFRKGDIAYVISEDYETVKEALTITNSNNVRYKSYLQNLKKMELNYKPQTSQIISDMYEQLAQINDDIPDCSDWISSDIAFSEVFDLIDDESFPTFKFKQHFIIFGNFIKQENFTNVISILRQYTNRPAILYSNKIIDHFKWNDMKHAYQNIFYVRGDFLNLDHLKTLEIKKAYKILILSDLMDKTFPDAAGLCVARILLDHYDRSDFLIELRDERKISFLNQNPKFKNKSCPAFLQPSFSSGNVHFTSMITAVLAKVVHTSNWIHFFKDLIIPNNLRVKQNKTINTLWIKDFNEQMSYFGQIQYALMRGSPSVIAIGVIKKTFGSKFHESLIDNFLQDEFYWKVEKFINENSNKEDQEPSGLNLMFNMMNKRRAKTGVQENTNQSKLKNISIIIRMKKEIKKQVGGILSKVLGDRIILTNPSFYTLIEKGDGIIVLGDQQSDDHFSPTKASSVESQFYYKFQSDHQWAVRALESKAAKYLNKLKNVKGFEESSMRCLIKEELIRIAEQKYNLNKKFYSAFEEHLDLQ